MADEHGGRFKLPWTGPARRSPRRAQNASGLDWRNTLRSRLLVCAVLLSLWTAAIEARLVYLQVIAHADLMARANRQQLRTVTVAAKRGEIVDRNGHLFAYSVDSDTIAADPSSIDQPDDVAARVCAALDGCDATQRRLMAERLRGKGQFAYLARQVSPDEAARVKSLKIDGVLFFKESRRYYPKKDLAASVLGYVGRDNAGLAGLESTFDKQIRGHEGRLLVQNDARRRVMATREERPATAGDSLELTIDEYLQHVVERELRAGVAENAAAGGTAVILNPQSGEILAMASWPTFNPNEYNASPVPDRRNRAIQDSYEPGSTFKVVTASAAIEEGLIGPDDAIDCSPGYLTFGPRRISDTHHYGVLPFIDVIAKSSNVGAIKVGMKLGRERLGRYISRFGFGQPVAPDFRGENGGLVWNPAQLDASALASVSMGYQVAVTPLQMAAAVSVVANGGEFVEPHVVRAVIRNGRREAVARKVVRRAISSETAATMTTIMEAVVERGTAKGFAQLEGFTVAGKTGTASKIVNNRYSKSDYNASFVGFVPSRKPVVTIVVVIDSPHAHGYYGASVSAPIFKKIAQATLQHLGVPRTVDPDGPVIVAVGGAEMGPTRVRAPGPVFGPVAPLGPGQMPDLRGLSLRAALKTLTQIGLTTRSEGSGLVLEQSLEPGAPIGDASGVVLKLGRLPATHAGGMRP